MSYFDILFPVNLGPLTYKCPEELMHKAEPGMIVSAPLKNKITKGILLGRSISTPPGRIKELCEIPGASPVLSRGMLKLIRWMADYYLAPEGVVLRYTVPAEIFFRTKKRKKAGGFSGGDPISLPDISRSEISSLTEAISSNRYRTFLMHAPSRVYEYSAVAALLGSTKNVIVLLPEVSHADFLYGALQSLFKERTCLFHGAVPKGRRSEYMEGIVAGKYDIVIGTRPALFAPLKNISLLVVLHEHSDSYKLDEGFRYHMRDVAVMRGFLEKCTVLLSSITPSVTSYFNALSGKYTLLTPASREKRPRVKIVDMRFEKKAGTNISKTVYEMARRRVREEKKIMFVINRRGYSTLVLCSECGHAENCTLCNVPLVMHNKEKVLRCHYCGQERKVPAQCGKCGSFKLELLGSGAQRVQEDIEGLMGVPVLRFDSDAVEKRSQIGQMRGLISGEGARVIVGTKMMVKHLGISDKFSMAAVLNGDASLNLPDFRASERTYMELSSVLQLVESDGEMIIQTRFPEKTLFKHLKEGDYLSFVKDELELRKSLLYPPYNKMVQIRVTGTAEVADRITKTLGAVSRHIEVLGPAATKDKKGADEFSFLLRSGDRNLLKTAAQTFMKIYGNIAGTKILADVDP